VLVDLDPRDLEVFLAVERQGSFGRAAVELLVTQPAVSERVRHLERVVGRPLFERTTRGAALTTAGETLLPYARRCVALAEEAVEAVRAAEGVPALVVAVHAMFAPRALPLVLGALAELPRRVSVRDAHSDVVTALVLDGSAHLGFAVPGATPPGLRRAHLRPDPIRCVASPEHPITHAGRRTIGGLRTSLLALNAWGPGSDAFLDRLREHGVDDWRIRYCGDAATSITLARDHGHVAFVPESAAAPVLAAGVLSQVPLAGLRSWTTPLDLLQRSRAGHDPAVAAVAAAVRSR